MFKLANISMFESLQNQAHQNMGLSSVFSVFNGKYVDQSKIDKIVSLVLSCSYIIPEDSTDTEYRQKVGQIIGWKLYDYIAPLSLDTYEAFDEVKTCVGEVIDGLRASDTSKGIQDPSNDPMLKLLMTTYALKQFDALSKQHAGPTSSQTIADNI